MSSLRQSEIKRKTNETDISVFINLDGNGTSDIETGIPFLDHMLHQISSHGLFDLKIKAIGDTHIDCLLYTSPSPRDLLKSRMPSSA